MIRELFLEHKYASGAALLKKQRHWMMREFSSLGSVIANDASPAMLNRCPRGE